jgi:signal transduction protein with GAF and PtsI domain
MAAAELEKHREELVKFEQKQAEVWNQQNQREAAGRAARRDVTELGIQIASTPEGRAAALASAQAELQRQQKSLDEDRRRRLRGFMPERFGGNAGEAFGSLLQFGSTSQLTNALNYEQQSQELNRRRLTTAAEQREYDIQQAKERGQSQLDTLHAQLNPSSPFERSKVDAQIAVYNAQQFALGQQAESTGRIPAGFTYGRSFEEEQGANIRNSTSGNIDQINMATEKLGNTVINAINAQQRRIESLQRELEMAAATNN